jgi:two-component system, LytTR family, response regulator AgrA
MLKIFICEDNQEQKERFTKIIQDIMDIENFDMEIALTTACPEEVVNFISKYNNTGIYFLDVDLKSKINGINLAAEIRKYDPRGFIIFVTTHSEMSYLTFEFKVEAMDYILKDNYEVMKERIHQCIVNANTKYSAKVTELQKNFSIKVGDKLININFNKILFFETSSVIHKIVIHALDRQLEFYAKMKDIEGKLDDSFYKCHKSYIVNKNNIIEIDRNKRIAYMINGEQCLISARLLRDLL